MDDFVEPVTEPRFAGVRPPPDFIVPVSYYYAQLYRSMFEQVDLKIKEAKDNSDGKIEDQRKLGEAIATAKRLTDALGGNTKTSLDSIAEPRRTEYRIAVIELNYALEQLGYIGSGRRDEMPLPFSDVKDTGAIASMPLTETEKTSIEDGMWRSDDFRKNFVYNGEMVTTVRAALDLLAGANPSAYGQLRDDWYAMYNEGINWKTKSTDAFWSELRTTLDREAKWFVGATVGGTNYAAVIADFALKKKFLLFQTTMEQRGHACAYGASGNVLGEDMYQANSILTSESNILSQKTQQAVQDFQQQISKQANYMNAITKVLESMMQLLRKLMP